MKLKREKISRLLNGIKGEEIGGLLKMKDNSCNERGRKEVGY